MTALTCREHDLDARGLRLRVCTWGPDDPEAPLALLLHGWLDQGATWERVARGLASEGWRVVAPDHRGHGRSDWAPAGTSYHFTDYVVDIDHVLRALGRRLDALVGHSMGGTLASLVAGLRPDCADHILLLEGLGPPADGAEAAADQLVAHLDAQARPRVHPPMDDVASAAERIRVRWTWDPMHRSRAAVAYDEARHRAILGRITAPVTLVHGTRSWYPQVPGLDRRRAALRTVRASLGVDAGHALHIDQPDAIAALVLGG
jgi:pimeloyl-ACP methyl ester carboxylesterase